MSWSPYTESATSLRDPKTPTCFGVLAGLILTSFPLPALQNKKRAAMCVLSEKIDRPGKWNATTLNHCHLFLTKLIDQKNTHVPEQHGSPSRLSPVACAAKKSSAMGASSSSPSLEPWRISPYGLNPQGTPSHPNQPGLH